MGLHWALPQILGCLRATLLSKHRVHTCMLWCSEHCHGAEVAHPMGHEVPLLVNQSRGTLRPRLQFGPYRCSFCT